MYIYIYINIYIIYIYMCVFIYVFIYICLYIYVCVRIINSQYSCGYNCQWRSCQKDQTVQAQMKPRWT